MEHLNKKHPLMKLASAIHEEKLEKEFSELYSSSVGHPPKPVRFMVGLLMLLHIHGISFAVTENFNWNSREMLAP
jgi:hypothetical protein